MKPFLAKNFLNISNSLKTMKRLILGLSLLGTFVFLSPELKAQEMGGDGSGGGSECKTEVLR